MRAVIQRVNGATCTVDGEVRVYPAGKKLKNKPA